MKLKKFMKTFVVCFALVALLTVSCFATSAQTTSTTAAAYGHYISPGEYVFDEIIDFSSLPSGTYMLGFDFVSRGINFSQIYIFINDNNVTIEMSYLNLGSRSERIYSGDRSNFQWSYIDFRNITFYDGFYITNPFLYQWWQSNVTRVSPGYESNLLDGFLSAFTMIGQWISGATSSLTSMFWANNSLTFLGTLAVAGLAFAVAFLIIGLIQRFLHFRG